MSKIKMLWLNIVALTVGIKTPYGRVKPRAFMALKQLTDEVNSLALKYDYAMSKNNMQQEKLMQISYQLKATHEDAVRMSKALKELANHPSILSPETQAILQGFKQ